MKSKTLIFGLLLLFSVVSVTAFYDHATNVYDSGTLIQNGNLRVEIYESASGGSAIYDQTFTSAINNGMWSVLVDADLLYGRTYFKDYEINGQDINFSGVDRLAFVSKEGSINASFLNVSGSPLFVNGSTGNVGIGTNSPDADLQVGEGSLQGSYIDNVGVLSVLETDNYQTDNDVALFNSLFVYNSTVAGGSAEILTGTQNNADIVAGSTADMTSNLEGTRNYVYYGADVATTGYLLGTNNIALLLGVGSPISSVGGTKDYLYIYGGSSPVISDAFGTRVLFKTAGAGSIENYYMFHGEVDGSSTSITNHYGFFLDNLIGTNSWGIYQNGSDDDNYFAGNVGIGIDTPEAKLEVGGDINASGGRIYDQGGMVAPPGMVAPFVNATCPPGWEVCDGSGTCPDMRDRFVRGFNSSGSRTLGDYQADALQNHYHNIDSRGSGPDSAAKLVRYDTTQTSKGTSTGYVAGARSDDETRPKNIALLYCMKQ